MVVGFEDLQGSGHALVEVLSQRLPRDTEEVQETLIQGFPFSGRDSNQAPPEYGLRESSKKQAEWFTR